MTNIISIRCNENIHPRSNKPTPNENIQLNTETLLTVLLGKENEITQFFTPNQIPPWKFKMTTIITHVRHQ